MTDSLHGPVSELRVDPIEAAISVGTLTLCSMVALLVRSPTLPSPEGRTRLPRVIEAAIGQIAASESLDGPRCRLGNTIYRTGQMVRQAAGQCCFMRTILFRKLDPDHRCWPDIGPVLC